MRTAGVAISTTAHEHRLPLLAQSIIHWTRVLPESAPIVVTIDAPSEAAAELLDVFRWHTPRVEFVRVGQPGCATRLRSGRAGVAVTKNTGLEALMAHGVQDLFLCDDDTWPLHTEALRKHTQMNYGHSLVCWGFSRLDSVEPGYARWTWPRGVLLHATSGVVEQVGGFVEDFGFGGHEHAEWSQRIHNAGLTPAPFISPILYAQNSTAGRACRAEVLWHCEDMRQGRETIEAWDRRRKAMTTVERNREDWQNIHEVMDRMEGETRFVPYTASANGRGSATMLLPADEFRDEVPDESDQSQGADE